MSFQEIIRIALVDTVLGMGTVFAILIFISICIWGSLCREKPKAAPVAEAAPAADEDGITPEMIAAITAAVHQYIKDQNAGNEEEYIVRNVRRATWRHTS